MKRRAQQKGVLCHVGNNYLRINFCKIEYSLCHTIDGGIIAVVIAILFVVIIVVCIMILLIVCSFTKNRSKGSTLV